MKEDLWKVTEESEVWEKSWIGYNQKGKTFGGTIIIVNGSIELIEAVTKAFNETEGQKAK